MKKLRRFGCILMCICMMFTNMSMSVFAEEGQIDTDVERVTNIRLEYEDGTYYLNCDMAEDVDYVDVTFHDGGHSRIDKESIGLRVSWLKPGETDTVTLSAWLNNMEWDDKSYTYTISIPLSSSTEDKPASPQNVKAEGGINTIRFSWDAVEGINVYGIFEVVDGTLKHFDDVSTPNPYVTCELSTKREEHTFVVLSKKDGVYSDYTAEDFIKVKYADISNIRHECSEATDYDLQVNWDATGYIADYTIGLQGHEDYRKTVSGSETGFTDTDPAYSETMKFTITVNSFDGSITKEYNVAVPDVKTFQKITKVRVEYEGGAYYLKWDVTEGVELVTITGADGSHWDRRADNCSLEINWLEAGESESVSIAPFSNGKYGVSTYYKITIPMTPPVTESEDKITNIRLEYEDGTYYLNCDMAEDVDYVDVTVYTDGGHCRIDKESSGLGIAWLKPGETGKVSLCAWMNDAKWDKKSYEYTIAIPLSPSTGDKPASPQNVKIEGGIDTIRFSWDAVEDVKIYEIFEVINGKLVSSETVPVPAPYIKYRPTNKKEEYTFVILSKKDGVYSDYTADDFITVKHADISNIRHKCSEATDYDLEVNWDATGYIEKYTIGLKGHEDYTKTVSGANAGFTDTDPAYSETMKFTIDVTSFDGTITKEYNVAVPDLKTFQKVTNVRVEYEGGAYYLKWDVTEGVELVTITGADGSHWDRRADNCSLEINWLEAGETESVSIAPFSNGKYGVSTYYTITIPSTPPKPQNIKVVPGYSSVRISWDRITGMDGFAVFMVDEKTGKITGNIARTEGDTTSAIFDDFTPSSEERSWKIVVRSHKDGVYSDYSEEDYVVVKPLTAPLKISNLRVNEDENGTAEMTWEVNGPVEYYIITRSDGSNHIWVPGDATSYTFNGGTEGYTICLDPFGVDGWGKGVTYVSKLNYGTYDRITNIRVTNENGEYYLKWKVTHEIESVLVTGEDGSHWTIDSENSALKVDWLEPGELYNVTLRACKYDGEYIPKIYKYTITIPLSSPTEDKPASPQNVKIEGGIDTIRFSWDAADGVNVYEIFEVVDGKLVSSETVPVPAPYIKYRPTNKKEEYTFVVLSKKDGVYSDYTADDFITVKHADISNIRHECSEATDYDLEVNWDATGYIEKYTIGLKGHEDYTKTVSGANTGFTDTDPAYSETMKFTIDVTSFDGTITKEYNVSVPDLKTFQKVTNVRVEYEDGAYYLKWDVTEGVEFVTVTGADGSHWDCGANNGRLKLNWLEAGESESVSIAPFSNGKYAVSTYYTITIPSTPPKPQNIKVVPGYSSIHITWDRIKGMDGFAVYVVDEKTGKLNGSVAGTEGDSAAVIYDDFSPSSKERSWKIVVRSHKDGVYSDYTEEDYVVVKPLTAPLKISNLRVNEDENGKAEMTWEVNGPVEYYIITCSDGSCHIWVPGDATSYTFNGGTEGYTIYLDPFGVDGWGKGVSYTSKPNYDAYDRITNIRVTNENGEYYLKWKVTNEIESVLVTGEDGSHWTIDSETSALKLSWMKPGKSYRVTLSALQYDGEYVPKSYKYTITIPGETSQGDSDSSSSSSSSASTTQANAGTATNPITTTAAEPQTVSAPVSSKVANNTNAAQETTAVEENENTVTFTLDSSEDWDELKDEIAKVEEGAEAVVVQMQNETVVPADILDTIKGKDVDVVLEMSDGISWTISGQNVKDAQDIDLRVVLNTENIPESVLNTVDEGVKGIPLSLVHNGEFGFDAILTIELEDTEDNQYASLFYFDEEKQELTFMEEVLIKDGKAQFKFEHASEWLIVVNETSYLDSITTIAKPAVTQDTDAADTAMAEDVTVTGAEAVGISEKSGVNAGLIIVIAVVVIAMIGGCGIMLSRKKEISE